jgi:hypothetical protein
LPNVTGRTWEYWTMRLAEAGRLPPKAKSSAKASRAPAKKTKRGKKRR